MVLAMCLLRAYYIAICLIIGVMTIFNLFPFVIALLLFLLLFFVIKAIPLQLAWNRSNFKNLIWMCITTILFSIVIYGYLYFKSGLIKNGVLSTISPLEALYFSVTTWTTVGYGDLTAPENLHLLTSFEAMNGYFAMGIFISLVVIWINEAISALDERMKWIKSLTPAQVQEIQNKIDPSIGIVKGNAGSSNQEETIDSEPK